MKSSYQKHAEMLACGVDSYYHVVANRVLFVGRHATGNMPGSWWHVVAIHTVMFSRRVCILKATLPETCQECVMWCLFSMSWCLFSKRDIVNRHHMPGSWHVSYCHVVANWVLFVISHTTRNMPRCRHVVSIHTVMLSQMG